MNIKETKKNIIQAGHKAVEELIKVAREEIVIPWKDFNKNMAISVEYNLEY